MGQLGIVRAGGGGKVARLHQGHRQAAKRGIARGKGAGGAAAHDQDIKMFGRETMKVAPHARKKLHSNARNAYLILPSLKETCLRSTGSYFLIENFSVMVRVFFLVT